MEYLVFFMALIVAIFVHYKAWPIFGYSAHPLGFVIAFQVLILTLPGIFIISYSSDCLGSITCSLVSSDIKKAVFIDYFIVLFTLFVSIGIAFLFVGCRNEFVPAANSQKLYIYICLLLVLFILVAKFVFTKNIPLITAFVGSSLDAEAQKASILRGEDGFSFPVINFFIKYFPLYFYYSCLISYFNKDCTKKVVVIAFIVTSLCILYDLQKGPLVMMVIGSFWLYWSRNGKMRSIILGGVLSLMIISFLFYISFDFGGDSSYFLDAILNRLFVAQVDGMFWVYNFSKQNELYLYWGLPFSSILGIEQIDPLSDIIGHVFPNANESWVNATSFMIGEAKAIFGDYSMIVSVMAISINVIFLCVISSWLLRLNRGVFYPAIFVMTQTLPLANNITDLLYGRFLFGFVLFMIFPLLAIKLERSVRFIMSPYMKNINQSNV
ncbi:O71 family O-antigen polymerase [Aeromonas intestinalis]